MALAPIFKPGIQPPSCPTSRSQRSQRSQHLHRQHRPWSCRYTFWGQQRPWQKVGENFFHPKLDVSFVLKWFFFEHVCLKGKVMSRKNKKKTTHEEITTKTVIYWRWWFQIFLIFTTIWGRFPIWLIFSRWVETTNQYTVWRFVSIFPFGFFSFNTPVPRCSRWSSTPSMCLSRKGLKWSFGRRSQVISGPNWICKGSDALWIYINIHHLQILLKHIFWFSSFYLYFPMTWLLSQFLKSFFDEELVMLVECLTCRQRQLSV